MKFKVTVRRTSVQSKTIIVDAESESEANERGEDLDDDGDWESSFDEDITVECLEEDE